MKLKWCFVIALGFLSLAPASLADTRVPLITATSDAFDGTLDISLTVDQNENATGVIYTQAGKGYCCFSRRSPHGNCSLSNEWKKCGRVERK